MIRWLRRLAGALLLALAAWWAFRIFADPPPARSGDPTAYPNEWGVRTMPLEGAELAAARVLEAAAMRAAGCNDPAIAHPLHAGVVDALGFGPPASGGAPTRTASRH